MSKYRAIAAGIAVAAGITGQAEAITTTVNDFTTITDGVFFDIIVPQSGPTLTSATFGGVAITGDPNNTGAVTSGFSTTPTAAVPGDNAGWTLLSILISQVTLTFDTPVAAFGMSVLLGATATPGTLEAFSGAGGTGTLLGTAISQSGSGIDSREFIGLWSDTLDILSVVFSIGSSSLTVDGYGLSLTANTQTPPGPEPDPEPDEISEPSSLGLLGLGLVALGLIKRRRLV